MNINCTLSVEDHGGCSQIACEENVPMVEMSFKYHAAPPREPHFATAVANNSRGRKSGQRAWLSFP